MIKINIDTVNTKKLAEEGDPKSQYYLGEMYYYGHGVTRSGANAVKWFRLAAENGNAKAQNHVGFMYATGTGVTENSVEAVKWYRRSATLGNIDSKYDLKKYYADMEKNWENI